MKYRDNSFDLIRHIAALLVLLSHHFVLYGKLEPAIEGFNSVGGIAVLAFFSISGFLITQSFRTSSSWQSYMAKRAARIFPALVMCAFVMVFIIGSVTSIGGGVDFVFSTDALKDFVRISLLGRADIEQLTYTFIWAESLNGSLWTLKIEFILYCVMGLALTLRPHPVMPVLMIFALTAIYYTCTSLIQHPLAWKAAVYCTVAIAFFVGSLMSFYKQLLMKQKTNILISCATVALMAIAFGVGFTPIAGTIGLSLLTLSIGTLFKDRLIQSRFDISYGIYLYAFPVQQLVINRTDLGFYSSMGVAATITVLLACASWTFIEKPAIRLVQKKYRPHPNVAGSANMG